MKQKKRADVELYSGTKSGCDFCGRVFRAGEAITVAKEMGMVFCYSNSLEGCFQKYLLVSPEQERCALSTMIFDGPEEVPLRVSWMEAVARFWGGLTAR